MWRVFDQPIGTFVYFFFVRCENFALYHNERLLHADPCCRSVIKEFAHAFSCASIELWMHLGSLEGTQKATIALGYALICSYAFFVLSKINFPRASITRYTHAQHEQILKFRIFCVRRFYLAHAHLFTTTCIVTCNLL